jgi:hypothetical protein
MGCICMCISVFVCVNDLGHVTLSEYETCMYVYVYVVFMCVFVCLICLHVRGRPTDANMRHVYACMRV